MERKLFVLMFLFLNLVACSTIDKKSKDHELPTPQFSKLHSYLWFQTSGEYRALSYQAYNLGTRLLMDDLQDKHNKPRAVVFDIDETVFDNSFSGAYELKNKLEWSKESFNNWVKKQNADLIAGAKEFIEFAQKNRVEVIFISNRTVDQIDDTYENFMKLNLKVKKENFYFQSEEWSKETRRALVEKKYHVVLYFGDNLHDFNKAWDKKPYDERKKLVDENAKEFGRKYIILPNPLYGDWEKYLPKVENRLDLLIDR